MICHLSINGLLACPKHIRSCDLLCVRIRDMLGDLFLVKSRETQLHDGLAHVSCFSESCGGLISGFPCGTFNLEL
jgi:hypothetical protein